MTHGLSDARLPDWETREDGGNGGGEGGGGDDPIAEIRTAITGFTTAAETRIAAIDTGLTEIRTRLGDVEKVLRRPGAGGGNNDKPTGIEAERRAIAHFVRTGDEARIIEVRAGMSVGSDPDGGYFVMPAMSAGTTKKLFDDVPMRRLARTETITAGDAWVEDVDFDEPDAVWVGEKETRPETDTPRVGQLRIEVEEIYANQKVTQRLLDDTGRDLGAWLEGKTNDKFVRTEGSAFVSGNGFKKPFGFLSAPVASTGDATRAFGTLQYIPAGHATLIQADGLRKLVWGLRAPYRTGATFLMNSNTGSLIDQLKDGQGQYLWRTAMTAGAPNTLLGYPVEISEDMPDVGADTYPVAFGNWKLGYVIVDKAGIKYLRDPFTSKPNVMFYAYRRVGGGVANTEAIKLLKIATS
jgi:HK97 family phage major capsid protein